MPTIGETSENASANAERRLKSLTGVLERSALVASGGVERVVSDMGFSLRVAVTVIQGDGRPSTHPWERSAAGRSGAGGSATRYGWPPHRRWGSTTRGVTPSARSA